MHKARWRSHFGSKSYLFFIKWYIQLFIATIFLKKCDPFTYIYLEDEILELKKNIHNLLLDCTSLARICMRFEIKFKRSYFEAKLKQNSIKRTWIFIFRENRSWKKEKKNISNKFTCQTADCNQCGKSPNPHFYDVN